MDEYNKAAEEYNAAVDKEYEAAVEETRKKKEENDEEEAPESMNA